MNQKTCLALDLPKPGQTLGNPPAVMDGHDTDRQK
jgi:hypothetical protein